MQIMTQCTENKEEWWCFCNTTTSYTQKGGGYTNLINHLKAHDGWEEKAAELLASSQRRQLTLDDFIDSDAQSTMRWLKLLLTKNLPLS